MKNFGKHLKCLLIISVVQLINSCTEYRNDIDLPEVESKLVVNSMFNYGDYFKINVSYSQTRNTTSELDVVRNAEVLMIEDNLIVDTLLINEDPNYLDSINRWFYYSKITPSLGKQYRVVVSANGYSPVYAISTVPEKAKIKVVDTEIIKAGDNQESKFLSVHLEMDSILKHGYYYFAVSHKRGIYSSTANYILFEMNDPVLGQHSNSIDQDYCLFTGELLADSSYTFSINLNESIMDSYVLYFELLSLSSEAWNYLETLTAQKNIDIRISEPVKVYSNVIGGRGIFGGINLCVDSLLLRTK